MTLIKLLYLLKIFIKNKEKVAINVKKAMLKKQC